MSLKINHFRSNLPKILWGIVILILLICIARVYIWEHNYYSSKEGSKRAAAVTHEIVHDEVDETKITDADKAEYIVEEHKPRFLSVEKLGLYNSRVLEVSLMEDGALDTPINIYDVGWYGGSDAPGMGGTGLYDGHNGGPNFYGVFKQLPYLVPGDRITIERGDGQIFTYEVVDNLTIPLDEANIKMSWAMQSPTPGRESITIISCTGEWSQPQWTYLSRQFMRAVLVE